MLFNKTRRRVQQSKTCLEIPSCNYRPRSSSGSADQRIANSSTFAGPAHATVDPSPNSESTVSVQVNHEAFQIAIQEYTDKLPDDDKVAFRSATNVLEKLAELQQGKSHISSSHTRMQRVRKVLQCLKRFLGSIAVCIQHNPEISSLVVGGLHCILTVSTLLNFNICST